MVSVVLALVVCLGLALIVLALVALPARRAGREVLSPRGEEVVGSLRERAEGSRTPGRGMVGAVTLPSGEQPQGSLDDALSARG